MTHASKTLFATLLFTPLLLAAWLGQIIYQDSASTEVIVPVTGYDPRDLLHGHYVRLTIAIPETAHKTCQSGGPQNAPMWLCLDNSPFTASPLRQGCKQALRVHCSYNQLRTDLTKFYIPEYVESQRIDKALQDGKGTAGILLSTSGKARLKQLFIEGKMWSEWLEQTPAPEAPASPNS